jgi:hypothetical protein
MYKLLLFYLQVNVIVEDENDNAPVFEHSSYEGHVEENSPGGTEVMLNHLIRARDPDVGHHAQFSFTLHGDGSELFTVNQVSGRVFVKGFLLDREEKALYVLKIIARDKGKSSCPDLLEWLSGFRIDIIKLLIFIGSIKIITKHDSNMRTGYQIL